MPLVNSITKYHKRFKNLNPLTDILVTAGGVEALFSCFMGLLDPGDEAVLIDPSYDCYRAQVQMAGAISRAVPLIPRYQQTKQDVRNRKEGPYVSAEGDFWDIDWGRFEKSLNDKTKVVVINSPHNPTGKIFSWEEYERFAHILKKYPRVVVIEDNVYEGLTFDEYYQKDLPKMSFIRGMEDRTLSVYSAGKIFACTGSRVGWVIGNAALIKSLMSVHQYNIFCQYDPVQFAMAESLDIIGNNDYMKQYADKLIKNKNILTDQLLNSRFDFKMWIPKCGYFIMTDISNIKVEDKYMVDEKTNEKRAKDMAFCIKLVKEAGVVGIPCSSFYDPADIKLGENMVRFAFCKD